MCIVRKLSQWFRIRLEVFLNIFSESVFRRIINEICFKILKVFSKFGSKTLFKLEILCKIIAKLTLNVVLILKNMCTS